MEMQVGGEGYYISHPLLLRCLLIHPSTAPGFGTLVGGSPAREAAGRMHHVQRVCCRCSSSSVHTRALGARGGSHTSQQCCWTPRQGQAGVQWPVTICVEGSQQCQGALQTQSNTHIHIPPFSRGRATRWKSNLNTHELPLHLKTSQLPNFLGRSAFRKAAFLPQRQPGNLFPQEQDTVVPLSLQAGGRQVSAHGASPPCY